MAVAMANGAEANGSEGADAAVSRTLTELITLDSEGGLPSFPQLLPALLHAIRMHPSPAILSNIPRLSSQLHKLHAAAGPLLLAVQAGDASRGADAKLGPWLAAHGVPIHIHTLAGAGDDLSAVVSAILSAIGQAQNRQALATSPIDSAAAEAADREQEAEAPEIEPEIEPEIAADREQEAEAATQAKVETQAQVEPEIEPKVKPEIEPERGR